MKSIFLSVVLANLMLGSTAISTAQEIKTLVNPSGAYEDVFTTNNTFTLPEGQVMRVLYGTGSGNNLLRATRNGETILFVVPADLETGNSAQRDYIIAGPAIVTTRTRFGQAGAFTIEISPSRYPPGKCAVATERDGPMKCTLEESTDLVNWSQSTSGQTHSLTNANAKKFFRIKLERDLTP